MIENGPRVGWLTHRPLGLSPLPHPPPTTFIGQKRRVTADARASAATPIVSR